MTIRERSGAPSDEWTASSRKSLLPNPALLERATSAEASVSPTATSPTTMPRRARDFETLFDTLLTLVAVLDVDDYPLV
jgi:hypothetical protein